MSVAVVGCGPAGMLVAAMLGKSGESVTLIDEGANPGGHLTYDTYATGNVEGGSGAWLNELTAAVAASMVTVLQSAAVWAAFRSQDGFELAVNHGGTETLVRTSQLVLATGTTDVPLIVPGATLPGVMTNRALKILRNRHGVIPAQRFVVVGRGADAERLKAMLTETGCDVVRVIPAVDVAKIDGSNGVQFVRSIDGQTYPADAVVLAIGEVPDLQIAGMLEVSLTFDPTLNWWTIAPKDLPCNLYVAGGALLNRASPAQIVESAMMVVGQFAPTGIDLIASGMPITHSIMQVGADN